MPTKTAREAETGVFQNLMSATKHCNSIAANGCNRTCNSTATPFMHACAIYKLTPGNGATIPADQNTYRCLRCVCVYVYIFTHMHAYM